jgi:hypothetical protein
LHEGAPLNKVVENLLGKKSCNMDIS